MRRKSTTPSMMKSYIAQSLLLLMKQKPFEEITVCEIVQKAGVHRSTYYRHFKKKEDVVSYFLDCISKKILNWYEEHKPDFRKHLICVYQYYYIYKDQMLIIYKNNLSFLFLDVLKKYLGSDKPEDKNLYMQYKIAFHIGGTFNQFLLWFSRDMADSPEEMAEHTLAVLPKELIEHIWNRKE